MDTQAKYLHVKIEKLAQTQWYDILLKDSSFFKLFLYYDKEWNAYVLDLPKIASLYQQQSPKSQLGEILQLLAETL